MSKAAELASLIGNINAGGGGVGRNLLINGAMNVAQRGTSATGIGTAIGYNTVDRWRFADASNPTGRFTQTQSTDAPDGFSSSHKFEVTTNDSSVDDNEMQFTDQFIEAQNLQHLKYGTSSAVSITLSFYVKSSVASTMGLRINHEDGGGNYGASYTINSVNTWEHKSITVPGNTATAINNDNGKGLRVGFALSAGSNKAGSNSTAWGNGSTFGAHTNTFVGTSGATWQITGVQLEIGQNPTEFEHEPFERTFLKCSRYFQKYYAGNDYTIFLNGGIDSASGNAYLQGALRTQMRATPTYYATNSYLYSQPGGTISYSGTPDNRCSPDFASMGYNVGAGSEGHSIRFESSGGSGTVEYDAEL